MRFLEPVFNKQIQVITLIEDLAVDLWIQLPQPTDLPILPSHQLLIHRRNFDELILIRQIEVRPKELHRFPVSVPFECELTGLVVPRDIVEIEELGELPLAVVGKFDAVGWALEVGELAQLAFASARRAASS